MWFVRLHKPHARHDGSPSVLLNLEAVEYFDRDNEGAVANLKSGNRLFLRETLEEVFARIVTVCADDEAATGEQA